MQLEKLLIPAIEQRCCSSPSWLGQRQLHLLQLCKLISSDKASSLANFLANWQLLGFWHLLTLPGQLGQQHIWRGEPR